MRKECVQLKTADLTWFQNANKIQWRKHLKTGRKGAFKAQGSVFEKEKTLFPKGGSTKLPKKATWGQFWSHKNILSKRKRQRKHRKLDVMCFFIMYFFLPHPSHYLPEMFPSCPLFSTPPPFPRELSLKHVPPTWAVLNQHSYTPIIKNGSKTNAVIPQSIQQNSHHF